MLRATSMTSQKAFFTVLFNLFMVFFMVTNGAEAVDMETYPNGAEAFMVGAAPPPGLTYVNYFYFYSADELKDPDGHDSGMLDSLRVYAEVARFIWISKKQLLGANYGQHFFILLVDADMDLNGPAGPNGGHQYHDTDIPYFIWSPMLLTWHLMADTSRSNWPKWRHHEACSSNSWN